MYLVKGSMKVDVRKSDVDNWLCRGWKKAIENRSGNKVVIKSKKGFFKALFKR